MQYDRVNTLCHIHSVLVDCSRLKKGDRPADLSQRLDAIQKLIMEEITPKPTTQPNDDVPF